MKNFTEWLFSKIVRDNDRKYDRHSLLSALSPRPPPTTFIPHPSKFRLSCGSYLFSGNTTWLRQGEHRTQSTLLLQPLKLSVTANSREYVNLPAASGPLEDVRHDQDCQKHQNNLKPFKMQRHILPHGPSDADGEWHHKKHDSKTGLDGGLNGPVHFSPTCM